MHQIREAAVTGHDDISTTLPVRVLADDGTTARILIEGCGVLLRQGQVQDVPSNAVHTRR